VGAGRTHAQVLGPYAAWIAVAGVAALCTTASASWGVAAAAITTMLLALVLMWRWVVALESAGTPPR
jgi:hypothetical protein